MNEAGKIRQQAAYKRMWRDAKDHRLKLRGVPYWKRALMRCGASLQRHIIWIAGVSVALASIYAALTTIR